MLSNDPAIEGLQRHDTKGNSRVSANVRRRVRRVGVSRGVRGEEIKCATESVLWLSVLPASSERCLVFSVTVALGRTPTCTRIPSLLDIYRFISPPLVVTLFILCFTRGKINLGKPKSFVISMGPTHSVRRNTFVCFILRICWLT